MQQDKLISNEIEEAHERLKDYYNRQCHHYSLYNFKNEYQKVVAQEKHRDTIQNVFKYTLLNYVKLDPIGYYRPTKIIRELVDEICTEIVYKIEKHARKCTTEDIYNLSMCIIDNKEIANIFKEFYEEYENPYIKQVKATNNTPFGLVCMEYKYVHHQMIAKLLGKTTFRTLHHDGDVQKIINVCKSATNDGIVFKQNLNAIELVYAAFHNLRHDSRFSSDSEYEKEYIKYGFWRSCILEAMLNALCECLHSIYKNNKMLEYRINAEEPRCAWYHAQAPILEKLLALDRGYFDVYHANENLVEAAANLQLPLNLTTLEADEKLITSVSTDKSTINCISSIIKQFISILFEYSN